MVETLEFHHTGLLVKNIEHSLKHYTEVFWKVNVSPVYEILTQGVKVCFVKNGINSYLELVKASSEESVVNSMMKKRISYYYIAYKADDFDETLSEPEGLNYKSLRAFNSQAFQMMCCCFLYTPDAQLIEPIEK